MTRRTRPLLAGLLALAVVAGVPVASTGAAWASPASSETPEVVVVLDSSGSMAEADAGNGQTRMDAAKQAVTALATTTPDTTRIGLRTYGDGVDSQAQGSCEDTTLRVPVGPVDRGALTAQVAQLQPRGDTPIGTALLAAAGDFTGAGPQSVVLVSDGEPTCDPDPCPVAAQLAEQGIDLRIDVIGFRVDPAARDVLQCIADSGNGQYVDAADAGELAAALDTGLNRGFRVYRPEGTPVQGSLRAEGAPSLTAGQYLDSIESNVPRYYLVDVPLGWTVRAGVTITRGDDPERRGVRGMVVTQAFTTRDEPQQCASRVDAADNRRGTSPMTGSIMLGRSSLGPLSHADCETAEQFLLEFDWSGSSDPGPFPMEITVDLEPPVVGTQGTGVVADPDVDYPDLDPLPNPAPVNGGTSFNDATELSRGAWADSMRIGETVFYRVPVDWGQQLAVRVDFEPSGQGSVLEQAGLGRGDIANLLMFDETRANVHDIGSSSKRYMSFGPVGGRDEFMSITTHPVTWANREESAYDEVRRMSRAGDVFLMLSMDSDSTSDDAEGLAIPYTVSVDLLGEAQAGPTYDPAATGEVSPPPSGQPTPDSTATLGSTAAADSTAAVQEPTATAGATSEPEPATDPEPTTDLTEATAATGGGGDVLLPVLVGVAALLLAALVGLVLWGVRTSRAAASGRPAP